MSEQMKQVLEMFTQPAFFVKDRVILWCNSAARFLIREGAPLASVLQGDDSILGEWNREGSVQISLNIQSECYDATVRAYEDMLLFVAAIKTADVKSSALAVMNASASLRKPLHSLISAANELFEQSEGEKTTDSAKEVNRSIYQLMRLCAQMADGSRLLLHQLKAHRATTNLQEFFENFVMQVRPLVESVGRTLHFKTIDGVLRADVDTDLLERALLNLLSNALSYTPKGGMITLQLQKRAKRLLISVSDNGEGIPAEVISSLFERYADRQPGDSRWGLGYGLPMVREIARLHDGTMMVSANDAQVGTNVIFTISLEPCKLKLHSPTLRFDYCGGLNHALVELSDALDKSLYDPSEI